MVIIMAQRKKKRTISPEHLAKLQAGRRKALESKKGHIVSDNSLSSRFKNGIYQMEHRNDDD